MSGDSGHFILIKVWMRSYSSWGQLSLFANFALLISYSISKWLWASFYRKTRNLAVVSYHSSPGNKFCMFLALVLLWHITLGQLVVLIALSFCGILLLSKEGDHHFLLFQMLLSLHWFIHLAVLLCAFILPPSLSCAIPVTSITLDTLFLLSFKSTVLLSSLPICHLSFPCQLPSSVHE